jgi:hypothetical protein
MVGVHPMMAVVAVICLATIPLAIMLRPALATR